MTTRQENTVSFANELDYTTDQNKRAIQYQIEKIEKELNALKTMLSEDRFGSEASAWTEGHVSLNVANLSALLSRQRAFIETLALINEAASSNIPMI